MNAEWAALKEAAERTEPALASRSTEFVRTPEEREKYRKRGEMLLRVINRMPDRLKADEKARTVDRIHRLAEGVGIGRDLQDTLEEGLDPVFGERVGAETFSEDDAELDETEQARVEALRKKVLDMTELEPGALAADFPSGTFLYHGSTVKKLEKIFKTGGLKNGVALKEDDPEISAFNLNSGFEGISWSLNAIDALPGTRAHIAGFVAAPEDVLSEQEKLVIPSRPAPYEVLQISDEVDQEAFYRLKNQLETLGDGSASMGEKNNVDSNLMWMIMYQEGHKFFGGSTVYNYSGDTSAEEMRKYFMIDDDRQVVWDADIYQKAEVPPALPWIQSVIDRGYLQNTEYAALDSVEKVVDYTKTDKEFIKRLLATVRGESKPLNEQYGQLLDGAHAVRVRPEKMFFVTSHRDLESWLKILARDGVTPKGILLYDDDQVIMENFASKYEGNHGELTQEIGRAIGVDEKFWQEEIGIDPANLPRSGHRGQVLLESAVEESGVRGKSIRVEDGKLVI